NRLSNVSLLTGNFALAPHGEVLAVARSGHTVEVLEMPSGTRQRVLRLPGPVQAGLQAAARQVYLTFSRDGRFLSVAWSTREHADLGVWDLHAAAAEPLWQYHTDMPLHGVAFGQDHTLVFTLGERQLATMNLAAQGKPVVKALPLTLATAAT